jgi:hypothetical protein
MPLHRRPTHSAAPRGTRRLPSDGRRHRTLGHQSASTVAIHLPMIPEGDLPACRSAPGTAARPAWSSGSRPTPADTDRRRAGQGPPTGSSYAANGGPVEGHRRRRGHRARFAGPDGDSPVRRCWWCGAPGSRSPGPSGTCGATIERVRLPWSDRPTQPPPLCCCRTRPRDAAQITGRASPPHGPVCPGRRPAPGSATTMSRIRRETLTGTVG